MSLSMSPSSPGVFVAGPSDLQMAAGSLPGGFFQGSLKVIRALARLVFSMLSLQHPNLGRELSGGLLPHPGKFYCGKVKRASTVLWRLMMQGWSRRKWLLGAQGEGGGWGRAKHLLPLFPPVRLPCEGGLENQNLHSEKLRRN